MTIRYPFAIMAALALAGCSATDPEADARTGVVLAKPNHPEARVFGTTVDTSAEAKVEAAFERAQESGKRVMLVMGANWCHDSRAFAGWLMTDRFRDALADKYHVVFVNIGMPQTGDTHNLAIAQRYGIAKLAGTPTVIVVTPDGVPVNPNTATSWRNSASRSEDAILRELLALADIEPAVDTNAES
ncbi:hypothetical protein HME9302_01986 [Alteripontixanthobacter maritimus]|uniref:Thioredoxin domain-containing protein n=1 Tax=Alteripontixanthobacter maritimus TaxID=2161824 RepID=A0A369Q8U5_9SPHN|nr:thioredoxin family protein [Alteripontixanthobacter maritimus]RDC60770.1 hypothetical protein HME9302_01986 [Alteripontixanthobacter maritimus]